jgi:hypothetical protein
MIESRLEKDPRHCSINCIETINPKNGNEHLSVKMDAPSTGCRSMLCRSRTFETIAYNPAANNTKYFSLNCDRRRVLISRFIFTGNNVMFRERWSRWPDRPQDRLSENNNRYYQMHIISTVITSTMLFSQTEPKHAMISHQVQIFAMIDSYMSHRQSQSSHRLIFLAKTGKL